VVGLNFDTARTLSIEFPQSLVMQAKVLHRDGRSADLRRQPSPAERTAPPKKLVLFQFSDNMFMEDSARGVLEELERSGVLTKHNITVDRMNGQSEFTLVQSIAQDIVRKQYDYIVTLSTPVLQTMAQVNKTTPHIFGGVTDPYRVGVAESPEVHQPNVTGVATFQPVESTIRVMRELFPDARSIGLVWNPSEACSEACTLVARQAAEAYGFELMEITINRTDEVMDAVRALVGKGVDLFLTSGDNTVSLALEPMANFLRQQGVPYFTNNYTDVERGAFVSIGADYVEVGRETGKMAILVIEGARPADTPIRNKVPEKTSVNVTLARELGVSLPESFLDGATTVE
jgi:putative ABC transport system permease protein